MIDPNEITAGGTVYQSPQEIDPLTEAVGDYKTEFPCLMPERLLDFTLLKITRKVKDDNGKHTDMLNLKLRLEEDATFNDGKPARKGFSFVQNILISPSGEYTLDSIKRILALWNKSIFGADKGKTMSFGAMRDHPDQFEGKLFQGRTAVKKDKTGQYGDQTQVTPVIPDAAKA